MLGIIYTSSVTSVEQMSAKLLT